MQVQTPLIEQEVKKDDHLIPYLSSLQASYIWCLPQVVLILQNEAINFFLNVCAFNTAPLLHQGLNLGYC